MAVYKRTYKAYHGQLTPAWSRFTVLSRYGFARLFASRMFTAFTVLCFVPFIIGLLFIYFLHSSMAQALLGMQMGTALQVNNIWFSVFLGIQAWLGFMLAAWCAPGMMSHDFANNALQLYLSRPLSRPEYLLGKVSVLVALLSCVSWVPALILFFLQASMEGHGWLFENLWLAGAIVTSALVWIAVVSLLGLATSVLVKWRIAATALMLAVFFMLPGFGVAMDLVLHTRWGQLFNLTYVLARLWASLLRIPPPHGGRLEPVPLWSAWATVFFVCAVSLWILNRRLKAREVE
jgi:ABC-2 type transport system permease protein